MTLPSSNSKFPRIPADVQAKADQIRTDAEIGYDRARSDGRYNTQTITEMIAKVYADAKNNMNALQAKATEDASAAESKRVAAAWGIDDVAGNNAVDRAAASMAYRDAIARADALSNEQEALWLLKQATETGDELLARALARTAYNNGWGSTLDAYAADRPKAAQAIAALGDLWSFKPVTTDLWAFVLVKPAEIQGYSDYQLMAAGGQ